MTNLTKPQRKSLHRKWTQDNQGLSYRAFRKTVVQTIDCIMVKWSGMWLAILDDGSTHS